jgi:hypothetical protein
LSLKLNPRQTYLDRLTKWPAKGKAVEHAQQNVKTAVTVARPTGSAIGRTGIWLPEFLTDLSADRPGP